MRLTTSRESRSARVKQPEAALKYEIERGPNWLFVRLESAALAGQTADDVQAWADELWSICDQHFTYRLVVEMDAVGPLPAEMNAGLIRLEDRLIERGGAMRLCGMSPAAERSLHNAHCGLRNHHSRREAVLSSDSHESVLMNR